MNIKFSMPELLVLFSLFMYSQSFWFAVGAFTLGVISRLTVYLLDYGKELKRAENLSNGLDELSATVKDMLGANKD